MRLRVLSIASASLLWLCLTGLTWDQPGPQHERRYQLVAHQKQIETVLKEHTDSLMALPGVVGTAIGECAGDPCIKVYVAKKTPELVKQIPRELNGFPVDLEETGEFRRLGPK